MKKFYKTIILAAMAFSVLITSCTTNDFNENNTVTSTSIPPANENNIVTSTSVLVDDEHYPKHYGLLPDEIIGIYVSDENQVILNIANSILEGYVYSNYLFSDNPRFEDGDIDWDIQYSESPSAYNLGLQTLDMVSILSKAYLQTKDLQYLQKAYSILENWIDYAEHDPQSNYVWYDHSVSSRVINIIYFLSTKDINSETVNFFNTVDQDRLIMLLYQHADYLLDPSNYAFKSNHGIMSDRALICLSIFLPNDPNSTVWLNTGVTRIKEQFQYLFNADGSYAENSPGYAESVLSWFSEIKDFLKAHDSISLGNDLENRINLSKKFLYDSTMPNNHYPMWGDTLDLVVDYTKDNEYSDSAPLSVYPEGGYAFFRDENFWLGFKSGYVGGMAHKHEDDLSFELFALDKDIFIDSGRYNYESSNPYRQYFVSANAHNTLVVDGQSFAASLIDENRTGILSWEQTANYSVVSAFSDLYSGVSIERSLYYIKPGVVLIFDNIQALNSHTYSQLFQLNEDIIVNQINKDYIELNWGSDEKMVSVYQLADKPNLLIHQGNEDIPGYGLISRDINKVNTTNTLEYQIAGQNASYVTLIDTTNSIKPELSRDSDNEMTVALKSSNLNEAIEIHLDTSPREVKTYTHYFTDTYIDTVPVRILKDQVSATSFTYTVTPSNGLLTDYEYTWYVHKDGKVIEKLNWSQDNSLNLNALTPGIYEIQAYLLDKKTNSRYTTLIDKIYLRE